MSHRPKVCLSLLLTAALGIANTGREINGVLVIDPDLDASSIGIVDAWELASGTTVSVNIYSQNLVEISTDGEVSKTLSDGLYVESGVMDREGSVLVLHVNRLEASVGGVFYSHLVVMCDNPVLSELPALVEVFQKSDVVRKDGRQRDLITLGCVDDFPVLDLFMGYNETNERPTATLYEWQQWNVIDNIFVRTLSSEIAEARKRGEP